MANARISARISQETKQMIERYADAYTSRVSNLLYVTPFGYLRASGGTLPHDT